jgi:hypothetical protein
VRFKCVIDDVLRIAGRAHLLLAIAALGCLAMLWWSPAHASADPRVCVYVAEPSRESITGHTFVQLLPDSGPQAGSKNLVYGFSTKDSAVWRALGGAGEVQPDADHAWSWRLCSVVSANQYATAQQRITRDIAKPPNYHLFEFNCTDWALRVVREAGFAFPVVAKTSNRIRDVLVAALGKDAGEFAAKWVFNGALFSDPVAVAAAFARIGAGGTFASGVVNKNTNGSKPTDIRRRGSGGSGGDELPASDIGSPFGLAEAGIRNPERMAERLRIALSERDLDAREVGAGDDLTIDFDDVADEQALVAVAWGDGLKRFEDPTATHRYDDPGTYRVRAMVLRRATLLRLELDVEVQHRGDGAKIEVAVPRDDPPENALPDAPEPIVPLGSG